MTDEHTKGTISKVQGKVEERPRQADRQQGAGGSTARPSRSRGAGQEGLGDVQDAVRERQDKDKNKA